MMMNHTHTPDRLIDDEAIRYISERHHTTAADVLNSYAAQTATGGHTPDTPATPLDDNEILIIHDLADMYGHHTDRTTPAIGTHDR